MQTVEEALKEFHDAYGLDHALSPIEDLADSTLLRLRNNLHKEEYEELQEGMRNLSHARWLNNPDAQRDALVEIADACCDLVYVVVGTCVSLGIPFDKCFAEVQRSNMSKLGEDGKPIIREEDGKILKGPNFSEPDLVGVIYGS